MSDINDRPISAGSEEYGGDEVGVLKSGLSTPPAGEGFEEEELQGLQQLRRCQG